MDLYFSQGQSCQYYSDSRCIFRVVHDVGKLWKQDFLTFGGNKIKIYLLSSEIIEYITFTFHFSY